MAVCQGMLKRVWRCTKSSQKGMYLISSKHAYAFAAETLRVLKGRHSLESRYREPLHSIHKENVKACCAIWKEMSFTRQSIIGNSAIS